MMRAFIWALWGLTSIALAGYLGYELVNEKEKPNFLIGQSSHGHYQIELSCDSCHTEAFGGGEVLQNACLQCHQEELKLAQDSHPKTKFTDPRNANLVKILDARQCTACHVEHNPDVIHPMGVSLPEDYCVQCHENIAEERSSHKDLGFETCASAGCHNYHDNRALYEDFLLKHRSLDEPNNRSLLSTDLKAYLLAMNVSYEKSTGVQGTDLDNYHDQDIYEKWHKSNHGMAEVGCINCHTDTKKIKTYDAKTISTGENTQELIDTDIDPWIEKPDHMACAQCHQQEADGFLEGKHGMRLNAGLSAMTPNQARLPMKNEALHLELSCSSCHDPHATNTEFAAVEACLTCHDDDHSNNYLDSPHGKGWQNSQRLTPNVEKINSEKVTENTVTCATCHLPRVIKEIAGSNHVVVEHNQNATLRPNEKMIRSTCLSCHSLQFSLDALADPSLINNNFSESPTKTIMSIKMAIDRDH